MQISRMQIRHDLHNTLHVYEEEGEVRVGRFFLDRTARLINLLCFSGAVWHLIFTLPAVSPAFPQNYSR